MHTAYPVDVDVRSPERFERRQLLARLLLLLVIGMLGIGLGWIAVAMYVVLPPIAALAIAKHGRDRYLVEVTPPLRGVLTWVVALYAYMLLVIDALPLETEPSSVRLTIRPTGQPTMVTALLRWLTALPSALVLAAVAFGAGLLAIVGALWVLGARTQPAIILRFQRGILVWLARLLAYHSSLVEEYPPFHLDLGVGVRAATAS